jgi:hypothetical protein
VRDNEEGEEMSEVRYNDGADKDDVLEASWGYDQTNVDYFKVERRTAASVWIVKIGQKHVPGTEGFMSERVVPDPDIVIPWRSQESWFPKAEAGTIVPQVKRVKSGYQGKATVRLASYAYARPVKKETNELGEEVFGSTYQSWYA